MSGAIKRLPGEKFKDFAARQKAEQERERLMRAPYALTKRERVKLRRLNRDSQSYTGPDPDGFNRDNLGESPDW